MTNRNKTLSRAFQRHHLRLALYVGASSILIAGCGDDDHAGSVEVVEVDGDRVGYGDEETVVVSGGDEFVVRGDPGDRCVDIGDDCVELDELDGRCDEGDQVDVVVVDGEVVEVVCYPPREAGTPVEEVIVDEDGNPTLPQNANGAVVVFDPETDGQPIEDNFVFDGERVVVYGNGVDQTIFEGNLDLASNNSIVRALTVQGNVTYAKNSNNSALSFCKIYGNLGVDSNDFTGFNCQIWGNVNVTGNNATLVNIGVQGEWNVNGSALCDGCYSFEDRDGDFVVDTDDDDDGDGDESDSEITGDLVCGGGN